jgi:hypothetical protein
MDRGSSGKSSAGAPHASLLSTVNAWFGEQLDARFHWDRLPRPLGIVALVGLRERLRERNLYDPGSPSARNGGDPARPPATVLERPIDGSGAHPTQARIGAAGTRFGRNCPIVPEADLAQSRPKPADVSEALLRRTTFQPATSLNLLAAAWLQFEVHDWFSHQVEYEEGEGSGPLGLSPLRRDDDEPGTVPVFLSSQTHWWDASQLYGANERFAAAIHADDWDASGRVKVDDDLLDEIARFVNPAEPVGRGHAERPPEPVPNLWVGLAIFQVAFAREHNAICDRLRSAYPTWSGERLYAQARLVNAAVMAKIHTVEWTPALIAHPTTVYAIKATWWGLLGERIHKRFGRVGKSEVLNGIPGSELDDEVPYSITEDFVAVYRLHPLIPDEVTFRHLADGTPMEELEGGATQPFAQLAVTNDDHGRPRARLAEIGVENAWYSLAREYPGALTLHNHPNFRPLLPSGRELDLGAADIVRTRECGVPRYNEFRRSLRMPPATTFYALADGNEEHARAIEQVYDDVEDVDLLVGLMADRKPAGFAISDTAFRVFLLMASRRLRSDPFFTTNFNADVYTPEGLAWIEEASMCSILRRQYPALEPALRDVENPFQPWPG